MAETITCPSGLVGSIRGLKVRDEDLIASGGTKGADDSFNGLIESCWLSTEDKGIYESFGDAFDEEGNLKAEELLSGDRMFILINLRRLSYGDNLEFVVSCANDRCKEEIGWSFDLSKLEIQTLPPESRELLTTGNKFPVDLPIYGKKAYFRLFTGVQERNLGKIQKEKDGKARMSSALLRQRIVEIEDVGPASLPEFILDLEGKDAKEIREAVELADCGVQTVIDIECRHCERISKVELPLGENFLGQAGSRKK